MVKLGGRHHVQAMRAYMQRKLALQRRQVVKGKEVTQRKSLQELPAYDPNDNGRFAGYDAVFRCEGSDYEALRRVLKKILRPAHYRTWAAANSDLRNAFPPSLSAKEIAEHVGRHRRTIEIDLQEMRESRFLQIQPARRNGRWVMEMRYDVLYSLVYEYLVWERSPDYVPAERHYFEHIELNPDLKQRLLQFEDYRKVLVKKKPGPKSKKKPTHHEAYTCKAYLNDYSQKNTSSDAPILPAASQGGTSKSVNFASPVPPALPQAGVSRDIHTEFIVEENVSQEFVSGSDHQEDSTMQNMSQNTQNTVSDDFELEDGMLIFNAVLPTNILDIRRKRNMLAANAEPEARRIPYVLDENDALHIPSSVIPKLRELLSCLRSGYEFFHHRLAFTDELQALFDEPAVGVWTSFVRDTGELVFRMEYSSQMDNLDGYKIALAEEQLAVARAIRERRKAKRAVLEEQGAPDKSSRRMKNPVRLNSVWTQELRDYFFYGDPSVRYFIPRTAFSPEEQADFPDGSVGLFFLMKPDRTEPRIFQCFEPFLEGINAQLEPLARIEARRRLDMQSSSIEVQDDGNNLMSELEPDEVSMPISASRLPVQNEENLHEASMQPDMSDMQNEIRDDEEVPRQELQQNDFPRMKNPVNLRDIWTPELEEYVLHGDPAIRYFVPRSDFPSERQVDFPDNSVGVLFRRQPETNSLTMCQCSEPFMEGIKAQLESTAWVQAEEKYYLHMQQIEAQPDEERLTPEASMSPPIPQEHDEERSDIPVDHPLTKQEGNPEKVTEKARHITRPLTKNGVRSEAVFKSTPQEIVHGGDPGVPYPPILPLLRDFMQQKLLGGDTEMRYFVPYEKLSSPDVEEAFPRGTDGIWIWKQEPGLTIHIKPTCRTLDPALKNRNLSSLSVAVGRVAHDDGRFYFDEHHDRGAKALLPASMSQEYDSCPRAESMQSLPGSGPGRRKVNHTQMPHSISSLEQQAQERYQTLLARAKDGKGKGLQRVF